MNGALQKFGNKSLKYSKITHSYAIGVIKEFQKDVHSIGNLSDIISISHNVKPHHFVI